MTLDGEPRLRFSIFVVAEVKYLSWTDDNLLRQVVYEGLTHRAPGSRRSAGPRSTRTECLPNLLAHYLYL